MGAGSGGLSKGGRASGRHLQAEKKGRTALSAKSPPSDLPQKAAARAGGGVRPEKKNLYTRWPPKIRRNSVCFCAALRPATQLHRRDGPANAPTLLGERKEYAGKGTGKAILYTGLPHRCARNWYRNKADPIKAGPCKCTGLFFCRRMLEPGAAGKQHLHFVIFSLVYRATI